MIDSYTLLNYYLVFLVRFSEEISIIINVCFLLSDETLRWGRDRWKHNRHLKTLSKMIKDLKKTMAQRHAKYVLLGFISVIAVILVINNGVTDHFGRNDKMSEPVLVFESTVNTMKSPVKDEGENKGIWQNLPKRKIKSATNEDKTTLEKIMNPIQLSCFNRSEPIGVTIKSYDGLVEALEATVDNRKKSAFYTMSLFTEMMSALNVSAVVIEPSVIYCMLKPQHRKLLEERGFKLDNFTGTNNVITYGILGDHAVKLENKENILALRKIGFQSHFIQETSPTWMTGNGTQQITKEYTSHVFYNYYEWTIHVVVFWKRSDYLWHAGLKSGNDKGVLEKEDLVFVAHDSAYENFDFVPVTSQPGFNFYIPSSPDYFLFQMLHSRFLECDSLRAESVKNKTDSPIDHSHLSVKEFNDRFLLGLQELKKFLNPLLMNFWIFSGTMLGWYRQCDIIPYTTDVDFGAWASEIKDLEYIIQHFRNSKKLYILERMGVQEEALEFQLRIDGLRVDLFFLYKINNGSWASGHRPSQGYYFRYHYPPFSLCSAELLQQKVQVPCETENVILAEYGPNWRKPVSSWNYESSIHNRGPNIYWDKERLPKAFQDY